ncbi:hypothetical protein [Demequina salsinemoris]|uniref:hypothetical protein n=1 Tax=Demequina salsinemoris TaxID=577470 RepID=UPI0007806CBA|nr:hypothetical protein [Demequina salsinemoris]
MNRPFSRALGAVSVVELGGTMLSGCAVLGDGPLEVATGDALCSTIAEDGATLYLAVPLDNRDGADDAVILKAWATDTENVESVDCLVDALGSFGSLEWPSDDEDVVATMESATEPGDDAVVPAGVHGTLLVAITPEDADEDAFVDEIAVTYRSGGHVHTVYSRMRVGLTVGDEC